MLIVIVHGLGMGVGDANAGGATQVPTLPLTGAGQ
jgi:hypothetical protein